MPLLSVGSTPRLHGDCDSYQMIGVSGMLEAPHTAVLLEVVITQLNRASIGSASNCMAPALPAIADK